MRGGVVRNSHQFELKKDDILSQEVKFYSKVACLKIGYDFDDPRSNKYHSYGTLYYDYGMNNVIIISSEDDGTARNSMKKPKYKVVVSKEDKSSGMEFVKEQLPFYNFVIIKD